MLSAGKIVDAVIHTEVPVSGSLELLDRLSRRLTSILDRECLLEEIARSVRQVAPFQLFSMMLWNPETEVLDHAYALRLDERIQILNGMKLGQGLIGRAAATRQAIRVDEVGDDPRFHDCGQSLCVRSELSVPVIYEDRLLGVLDIESTEPAAFTAEHEQLLGILASYVAIALENARLYEEVASSQAQLEADLEAARQMQRALLPKSCPSFDGLEVAVSYCPAKHLGGDFYDVLRFPSGRSALVVGDVAGKGAAAALYGALAIGVLRGRLTKGCCSVAEMLSDLNQTMRELRALRRFVALGMVIWDPEARTLELGAAGFPRPWLIRGGRATEIEVGGLPLGALEAAKFSELTLELELGDLVVLCSDGCHEALDGDAEQLGIEAVRQVLEAASKNADAQSVVAAMVAAVDRHNGGRPPSDDRTIMVMRAI